MDQYFGFAKELFDKGLAAVDESYGDASDLYDQTIQDDFDISYYVELARQVGGKVLDLGCGTGRILLPLLRAGIRASGLDNSAQMLEIARRKITGAGYEAELVLGDIRNFQLQDQYELILLPYYTMIYMLSDVERLNVLRSVHSHLKPGGVFAFDFDAGEETPGESKPWISLQRFNEVTGEVLVRTAQMKVIHKNLRVINQISHRTVGGRGMVTVSAELEATIPAEAMRGLLEKAGFNVEKMCSDYQGTPYTGGAECVVLARKAG